MENATIGSGGWTARVSVLLAILLAPSARLACQLSTGGAAPQTANITAIVQYINSDPWLLGQNGPKFVVLAPWVRRIATQYTPGMDIGPSGDPMGPFFQLGHYKSSVYAGGSFVAGLGEAWDVSIHDRTSIATAMGSVVDTWKYAGSRVGDIEVTGRCRIGGVATVHDNDGAAAALGYCMYDSPAKPNFMQQIDSSVGASSASQIGNVTLGSPLEIGVGVGASVGEGTYPDHRNLPFNGYAQVDFASVTHATRGYIKVWANGTPPAGLGESSATLAGYVESTNILAEHW